eukprot:11277089-Ditylum_brightwellii.AAC.1
MITHAVELSVRTGVGGWGGPSPSRPGTRAPISASAVDAMTLRITLQTVCTGPFRVTGPCVGLEGSGEASLKKKWPPALLLACVSNIKEASE